MSRLVIVGTDSACPLAQQGLTDAVVIAAILPDPPGLVKAESHRERDTERTKYKGGSSSSGVGGRSSGRSRGNCERNLFEPRTAPPRTGQDVSRKPCVVEGARC